MVADAIGLYILKRLSGSGQEITDPEVVTDGMADGNASTDLSNPENTYESVDNSWWSVDPSKEVMEPGADGSCLVGYKKEGNKCLPILFNLESANGEGERTLLGKDKGSWGWGWGPKKGWLFG